MLYFHGNTEDFKESRSLWSRTRLEDKDTSRSQDLLESHGTQTVHKRMAGFDKDSKAA